MDHDSSFGLRALLKKHTIKGYKPKPLQFESVAGGVVNRLEYISNHRRISRLNTFDRFRDLQFLSPYNSPAPIKEAQHENQLRKQLQKWKEEKKKKKKEAAANKTKPFLSGISHNSLSYVPPPPLPKAKIAQSHSGRVTKSQTARNNITLNKQPEQQSFAPKNAGFRHSYLRSEVPILVLPIAKKGKETGVMSFTFQPTAILTDVKQAQSRQTPEPSKIVIVTPGRSILKQSRNNTTTRSPCKKSIKVVLFNQPDSDTEEKNTTTVRDNTKKSIEHSDVREMDTSSEEIKVKLSVPVSPVDVERDSTKKDKENIKRRTGLCRQNAVEETRSVRKCRLTPKVVEERNTPRRSTSRTKLEEREKNNV